MNDSPQNHVSQIVDPIHAGPWRKEIMRRDLLAHLHASMEEEGARDAIVRLGNAEDLRGELQATVPWVEQLVFRFLSGKEISMARWAAIILVTVSAMIGVAFALPEVGALINMSLVALISLLSIVRLWDKSRAIALRSSALLLIGIAGSLLGPAMVMPAWAKMNHGVFVAPIIAAMAIGIVITLEGLGFIVLSIRHRTVAA